MRAIRREPSVSSERECAFAKMVAECITWYRDGSNLCHSAVTDTVDLCNCAPLEIRWRRARVSRSSSQPALDVAQNSRFSHENTYRWKLWQLLPKGNRYCA